MRHVYLRHLVRAAKVVVVLAVAVLVGLAATTVSVLLAHEILVLIYGDDLSPIDDTLPMITTLWGSYLVGSSPGWSFSSLAGGGSCADRRPSPGRDVRRTRGRAPAGRAFPAAGQGRPGPRAAPPIGPLPCAELRLLSTPRQGLCGGGG
jgi:hypothetical protein